jgi:hypothetical protein
MLTCRSIRFLIAVVCPLALLLPSTNAQSTDVAKTLARVREAVSYQPPPAGKEIRARCSSTLAGLDVECSFTFSGGGQSLLTTSGPAGSRFGLDGETAWEADLKGACRILALDERDDARFLGWAFSQFFLDEACPITYTSRAEDPDDGSILLNFEAKDSPARGFLRVDPETWDPLELSWHGISASGTHRFGDYRSCAKGHRFPHRVTRDGATTFRFDSYELASRTLPSPFAPPLGLPEDTYVDVSIDPEVKVMRVRSGHLLVRPTLDGEDIGWFALDTAAGGECIDSDVAFKFGLDSMGKSYAGGVGGVVETSFWQVESLELGPVFIDGVTFVGLDLKPIGKMFGTELAGILGYGFLSRCVVEIDVSTPRVALYDPGEYELEGGSWQKLVLQAKHPCVEASFEGHEGLFRIDTGAGSSSVIIHASAVQKYQLLEERETQPAMAGGVGGMVKVRSGQLENFVLGGHRFEKPQVIFATDMSGALADPYTLGTIGGKSLEPFVLVLDYPNQRIGFKPKGK